ncbi:dTDP-4-dehydrorhamnose reductase [Marinomonas posidonica]|uniref:dTDP-4-dehydrorhamnose reductase n=1 Tax=Marinomonas posidonica (strain CECT 7376 / NCIMB 14433 / IVIA-Po-181) TaxID=491952 RepID=F6CZQ6_MARPP|nr:dTDP-4-dehydrorhamnose reductase [Marinomonas posidonica]AEF53567.1 dTDP-4-dehydrorhamnose reductase [Marinomonas posidonica IVIA-Po-181]
MRILLTGKNGQLGRCFQDVVLPTNHELFAFASSELDITNIEEVSAVVSDIQPDIIVNAAAYTGVDKAEIESEQVFLVNATGPEILAKYAARLNIPLIHVSTDYVFDGAAVEPYQVFDKTNPQGVYGASKLAGEQAVAVACEKYIILRTAWVFSEYGNNFVQTMMRLAKERDELSVVADQYGCPTYAGDLAQAILQICEQYKQGEPFAWGLYHYCGDIPTSWHGFARTIFAKAEALGVIVKRPQLKAISSDQYPTPAKRPEYSVMSTKALSRFGVQAPSWSSSLNFVLDKLK